MDQAAQQREVDLNYDFFQRNLAKLMRDHAGQYALLRSSTIIGYFSGPGDAFDEGIRRFPDRRFSIQEVTDEPVHLGFWSVAAT